MLEAASQAVNSLQTREHDQLPTQQTPNELARAPLQPAGASLTAATALQGRAAEVEQPSAEHIVGFTAS